MGSEDFHRQLESLKKKLAASKLSELKLKEELAECQAQLKRGRIGAGGSSTSSHTQPGSAKRWWHGRFCPERAPVSPELVEPSWQDAIWQLILSMEDVNALLCNIADHTIDDASKSACITWGSGCLYGNPVTSLLRNSSRASSFTRALEKMSSAPESFGANGRFQVKDLGCEELENRDGDHFDALVLVSLLPAEPRLGKPPKLLVIARPQDSSDVGRMSASKNVIRRSRSTSGESSPKVRLPKQFKVVQQHKQDESGAKARPPEEGKVVQHKQDADVNDQFQLATTCESMARSVSDILLHLRSDLTVCSSLEAQDLGRQEALFGRKISGDYFGDVLDPDYVGPFLEAVGKTVVGNLCFVNTALRRPPGVCLAVLIVMQTGQTESCYAVGILMQGDGGSPTHDNECAASSSPWGSPWQSEGRASIQDATMGWQKRISSKEPSVASEKSGALQSAATGHTDMNKEHIGFAGGFWKVVPALGLGVGDYKAVRPVGLGGQGVVFHVKDQAGNSFALKKVNLPGSLWQNDFPQHLRNADREARVLKSLAWASAVIVRFHDCWIQDDFKYACIVMEWLPKSLSAHLKERKKETDLPVPTQDACRWITHVTTGLAIIHGKNFMHRDIKPANLMLTEDLHWCKIADLGLGRALHEAPPAANASQILGDNFSQVSGTSRASLDAKSMLSGYTEFQGTADYMSPEAIEGGQYSASIDMFATGCVLLELLTSRTLASIRIGKAPVARGAVSAVLQVEGKSCATSHGLAEICLEMLSESEDDRPTARNLLRKRVLEEWVQDILTKDEGIRAFLETGGD